MMNKSNVGKFVGAVSLFGGGAIIGAAVQEEIRTRQERRRMKEDAAEDRLRLIEERLRCAENDIERRDELIKRLTNRLEAEKTKDK